MASVLVVDDSAIMRINIKSILSEAGHTVVAEADSGSQAFIEYQKFKPDLITMDVNMPGITGIEATKKILKSYPEANIIIVSSLEQKNQVVDALEAGAKHYVLKPITPEKLLERINYVLEGGPKSEKSDNDEQVEEEKIEEKIEEIIEPFSITNKLGVFIVKINSNMTLEDVQLLNKVAEGISYIKPLSLIFDFNDLESLEMNVYNFLVDAIKKLFDVEAVIKIIVKNKGLSKFIMHNTINNYATIYSSIEEAEKDSIVNDSTINDSTVKETQANND